ncbi:hypothetical protein [uncultured Paludibaculum sp.]|uniref:hypothetical protein n=1 Tax=uncultured Paludibaculum sp. TaxID=1765020 RepID=UPI002AAC3A82|nr:hypothetical protein [uncultured Paludibaculum sp.]
MMARLAAGGVLLSLLAGFARQRPAAGGRMELGRLASGAVRMKQAKPAQVEVYRRGNNVSRLAVGANGLASNVPGEVDQHLDWSVPSYARLYQYTKDPHYLEVARVLLHDTKAMLALPRRSRDWGAPDLASLDFRQPPARRHRAGGTRQGSISAIGQRQLGQT